MSALLIESHYFPSIAYFHEIIKYDTIVLDDTENFTKQTYRNRAVILGANGKLNLVIPMDHHSKRSMSDIKVNYREGWDRIHRKSIESAYRKSPYFDYYGEEIIETLCRKETSLFAINYDILTTLFELLSLPQKILKKSDVEINDLVNLRNTISPKKKDRLYQFEPYHQVFGSVFTENLSILDLVFSLGPETALYLKSGISSK